MGGRLVVDDPADPFFHKGQVFNIDCDQSLLLAQDLKASGYLLIHIYTGGYEEWTVMGQSFETGAGDS